MTQTLTALSQRFGIDEQSIAHFQEALSPEDQQSLSELFDSTQLYGLAARYAGPLDPMALFLLVMLIEEHKRLRFLVNELGYYQQKHFNRRFNAANPPGDI